MPPMRPFQVCSLLPDIPCKLQQPLILNNLLWNIFLYLLPIHALALKQADHYYRSSRNTQAPTPGKCLGWYTAISVENVLCLLPESCKTPIGVPCACTMAKCEKLPLKIIIKEKDLEYLQTFLEYGSWLLSLYLLAAHLELHSTNRNKV